MLTRQFDNSAAPKADAVCTQQRSLVDTTPSAVSSPTRARHVVPGAVLQSPPSQATALTEASGGQLARAGQALLQLQRRYGNRYVQQVVRHASRAADLAIQPVIQTNLVVGPAGDRYERAADRVAQQVVEHTTQQQAGDTNSGGRVPWIQPIHGITGRTVDASVQQAIDHARGRPLPGDVRFPMERAMGCDFSRVRLHTDVQADHASRALGARGFTTGQDIFLRRGEYDPGSRTGRAVLAHELTHVVQQTEAGTRAGTKPRANARQVIQRLIAVPPPGDKLYVPTAWMNAREADQTKTPRDVLNQANDHLDRVAFLGNIELLIQGFDPWTTEIKEVNVVSLLSILGPKNTQMFIYDIPHGTDQQTIANMRETVRSLVGRDLDALRSATVLNDPTTLRPNDVQQVWGALPRHPLPHPSSLIPDVPDLVEELNPQYVCVLISLAMADPHKSDGIVNEWSQADMVSHEAVPIKWQALLAQLAKGKAKVKDANEDVYMRASALHWYYFTQKGVLYDDSSSHPRLFEEWGFNLVFSGDCSFSELPSLLSQPLERNKGYIFDVTGHTVYVTMSKKVDSTTVIPSGHAREFFKFHDQKWNWNKSEENETRVECIYGR